MQCDERLQMIMLSGGRTTSLECIAFICQNIVGVFGVSLQNTAVQGILSRPDLIALGYLLYSINGTADIKSRWRHNRKSAQVVNSDLVCNPTIQQPGFDLLRQQWSLLNHFRTEQGHCGACRRKWRLTDTDQCPFGETQTMSHIVESCPLAKLNGGLSQLHSADEDAVSWLTNYGS